LTYPSRDSRTVKSRGATRKMVMRVLLQLLATTTLVTAFVGAPYSCETKELEAQIDALKKSAAEAAEKEAAMKMKLANVKAELAEERSKPLSPSPPPSPSLPECPKPSPFPLEYFPDDSQKLLAREGVIEGVPAQLCTGEGKNVILVIGDGMGWEMIRAGAIAKKVLAELEGMGVDTKAGATGELAATAKAAFAGRTLNDYYTEGKGEGLSFQDLSGYAISTTTVVMVDDGKASMQYASTGSMLAGSISEHDNMMSPPRVDADDKPMQFNPKDFETEGGMMILWNDTMGGKYPWDACYYPQQYECNNPHFDKRFKQRHATDSASTAGSLATGEKAAINMQSVDMYERPVTTLVENALMCGKAAGVMSTVPILHATPGAFVTHSNYRKNGPQMARTFIDTNPTVAIGTCASRYYPKEYIPGMKAGTYGKWTVIEQSEGVSGAESLKPMEELHPDSGDKVLGCYGGDYTSSGNSNLPYRGIDSSYHMGKNRYAVNREVDEDGNVISLESQHSPIPHIHYTPEEEAQIPTPMEIMNQTLNFLGKDKDGFFLMYEQGDIDWAAHEQDLDDMIGTMLDISDTVQVVMDWIANNGGWEKNALYVTADHDHYLSLQPKFPEQLAKVIIEGRSHEIVPNSTISGHVGTALNGHFRNASLEPLPAGVGGKYGDDAYLGLFKLNTWSEEDFNHAGHFWGAFGDGGNAWDSHSMKPVPVSYQGDTDNCIEKLKGKPYKVAGKDVRGSEDKVDQVHIHACMFKALMGY